MDDDVAVSGLMDLTRTSRSGLAEANTTASSGLSLGSRLNTTNSSVASRFRLRRQGSEGSKVRFSFLIKSNWKNSAVSIYPFAWVIVNRIGKDKPWLMVDGVLINSSPAELILKYRERSELICRNIGSSQSQFRLDQFFTGCVSFWLDFTGSRWHARLHVKVIPFTVSEFLILPPMRPVHWNHLSLNESNWLTSKALWSHGFNLKETIDYYVFGSYSVHSIAARRLSSWKQSHYVPSRDAKGGDLIENRTAET